MANKIVQLENEDGDKIFPVSVVDFPITSENYTIATSGWAAITGADPFKYSATVTTTYTIGNNTQVELINNQAIPFVKYGFAIGSVSGQNITIYSLDAPDTQLMLTIDYKETT